MNPSLTLSLADSDLANGKSVWTGSITIPLAVGGPTTTRDARFTLSVTDLSDIALPMVDSSRLSGFPTVQQGVLHVADSAGFKANMLFEIDDGPGYDAALAVYDALPTVQGNQMWSSVGGAFYAVIPELGVLSMIGMVGGGIWFIRRRFVIQETVCQNQPREKEMGESLYERLGDTEGITQRASDVVDNHLANQRIFARFSTSDVDGLKHAAATFFITGTGGPEVYQGKDMAAAHAGMNIDAAEFVAVLDDALEALEKNKIGQRETEEVLYILYSMKGDITFG